MRVRRFGKESWLGVISHAEEGLLFGATESVAANGVRGASGGFLQFSWCSEKSFWSSDLFFYLLFTITRMTGLEAILRAGFN